MHEVDELRLEPVARGAPLVLRDQGDRLRRQRALGRMALGERGGERLGQRDERGDCIQACLAVADPDLDRAEPRVRADVPPDVRVVLEAVRADPALDEELVLVPRGERRRQAAARERVEDLAPGRRKARVAAEPVRRVRGEREQLGEPRAQRVRSVDRLVGALHADVDVKAEDQLALGHPLHRVDQVAVALLLGDVLVLVTRERVRAGRGDQGVPLPRRIAQPRAERTRLVDRRGGARVDVRRDLDRRLEELRLDPLVRARGLGHLVEARDELVAVRGEQHELLLDSEAERVAVAEVELHSARRYPVHGIHTHRAAANRCEIGTDRCPRSR